MCTLNPIDPERKRELERGRSRDGARLSPQRLFFCVSLLGVGARRFIAYLVAYNFDRGSLLSARSFARHKAGPIWPGSARSLAWTRAVLLGPALCRLGARENFYKISITNKV